MIQRSSHQDYAHQDHAHIFKVITLNIITNVILSTCVMAQGPFNTQKLSDGYNAYYMSILSALAYEDEDLMGDSYRKLGLSRCTGSKKVKVLDEVNDNTSGHLSTDGDRIFLVMRGTDDAQDILKNLKLVSALRPGWGEVPIHKGFSELAESFITSTHLYDKLKKCGSAHKEIYVGGHSMGGALANIIAVELKLNHFNIKGIYTYGSPRIGGEAWISYFNQSFPQRHFQWRNLHDPVPSVPKGALQKSWTSEPTQLITRLVTGQTYQSFKHLILGRKGSLKIAYENINPFDGKGTFSYHNKKKYAFDLWTKFSLNQRIKSEFSPLSLLNVGKLSAYCSTDSHCQKYQYCSTTGKNKCTPKKKIGSFCLRSKSCRSARCVMGQCRPKKNTLSQEMRVIPNDPK